MERWQWQGFREECSTEIYEDYSGFFFLIDVLQAYSLKEEAFIQRQNLIWAEIAKRENSNQFILISQNSGGLSSNPEPMFVRHVIVIFVAIRSLLGIDRSLMAVPLRN